MSAYTAAVRDQIAASAAARAMTPESTAAALQTAEMVARFYLAAAAAANPRLTDADLRELETYGPLPATGLATDYDVAHLAGTLLKVREVGVAAVAASDVERAGATLGRGAVA